jgi:hypothetical protein
MDAVEFGLMINILIGAMLDDNDLNGRMKACSGPRLGIVLAHRHATTLSFVFFNILTPVRQVKQA